MSDCSTAFGRACFSLVTMSNESNLEATSASSSVPVAASPARRRFLRVSVRAFLAALVMLFIASPFVEQIAHGDVVEVVLMTLVLITGVMAVSSRRATMGLALLLVAPALVGKWLNHFWPEQVPPELFVTAALIFVTFVIARLMAYILRAPRVNAEVLCAGISAYLLLGIIWAMAYIVVARLVPNAFTFSAPGNIMHGFTAFYFSFVTLTTVGYGDICPVAPAARMLTIMESMTGTLFVGMLIARLVSLYSSTPSQEPPSHS